MCFPFCFSILLILLFAIYILYMLYVYIFVFLNGHRSSFFCVVIIDRRDVVRRIQIAKLWCVRIHKCDCSRFYAPSNFIATSVTTERTTRTIAQHIRMCVKAHALYGQCAAADNTDTTAAFEEEKIIFSPIIQQSLGFVRIALATAANMCP